MGEETDDAIDAALSEYEDILGNRSMPHSDDYVTVFGEYKHHTGRAVLLATEGVEHWIPRSVLAWSADRQLDNIQPQVEVEFRVRQWFCDQEGIEYS